MKKFFIGIWTHTKKTFGGVGLYAKKHKVITTIVLLVIVGVGYWGYGALAAQKTAAQYVLATAMTGPIEVTVTGSGQVASSHSLDLAPKASGEITAVYVRAGDAVATGQVIATIDSTTAQKAVRDAEANLTSAQLSLQKLQESDTQSVDTAKAYADAFTTISTTFTHLASALPSLDGDLHDSNVPGQPYFNNMDAYAALAGDARAKQYETDAQSSFQAAEVSYQSTFALYKTATISSDPATIQALLTATEQTAALSATALKDSQDFLNYVSTTATQGDKTVPNALTSSLTSLNTYASEVNADVSSLTSADSTIANTHVTTQSNSIDVQADQLAIQQRENALQDARDALSDYVVRAPFGGTIATVDLQQFDQASASTKVATLITTDKYAELSLNETDAAKIQIGQKATVTFDAIDGLTMNGSVAEVDNVGTVSQGVVTYNVKIAFDIQDPRILSGMTANATIITASKDNALLVPAAAVKSQGTRYYVQVAIMNTGTSTAPTTNRQRTGSSTTSGFSGGNASSTGRFDTTSPFASGLTGMVRTQTVDATSVTITRVPVTIGLTNDTVTEIVSGLAPGARVVTQSLNASGTSTTQSNSILSLLSGKRPTTAGGTTGAARATGGTTAGGARAVGGGAGVGGFTRGAGAPASF